MSQAISDYVDKRLDKIATFVGADPSIMCDVELSRTTEHHKKGEVFRAEVHIVGSGLDAYAAADREDLYAAIDDVRDDILRELKVKKGKQISYIRRGGAQIKAMAKGIVPWGEKGWYKRFK